MPSFSKKSMTALNSCSQDIQTILLEAIKYIDFSIIEGQRTAERQAELYAKGRTEPGEIVSNCDGIINKSKHQASPKSKAADVVPYPTLWENENLFFALNGVIETVQKQLLNDGRIKHPLKWGGNWLNLKDLPHYEI